MALWPLAGSAQSSRGRIPPSPGPFAGGVTAQGRIVPAGGVLRLSAPAGVTGQAIVRQLMVKEGDSVETDQLLAVLRGQSVMKAQADAAAADQAAANAALTQAQAAQTRTVAELNAQLADLTGRAATADAALSRATAASQLALEQAKSEEAAAKAAFDNAKALQLSAVASTAASVAFAQAQLDALPRSRTTERTVATAQLEQAKAEKKRADTEMANQLAQLQAQADLASLRTKQAQAALITEPPADPANLSPEQAQARAAHAAVNAQKQLIEAATAETAAAIATAQAHLAAATASAAAAQAQLALTEIRAPSAGRVLTILTRPGEAVGPGGILQLGDTRDMYVDALVYIDDVPSVHLGQKTMTTGSALPGDGLTGVVVTISPMVAGNTLPNPDPTVFSDQPVVLVKVRLDNPAPAANLVNGQVKVQFAP
ncbi:MAG TPA: HlyD family efflux transporter periplasmic adaptor subunit [Opitutales bacterium]|nr:HlyD family efflux transporter periplasmic adaptor subunit [Opitutales bacterium]